MKVVFLDRDGVINKKIENGYVLDWKDFEFLPDVDRAIKLLNEKNIPVIIISNQACVGKALISDSKLNDINNRMIRELGSKGAWIDDVFVCPHRSDENCDCRKPKTGLFRQAAAKHDIDLKGSWFIGDSDTDVEAGKRAGCRTYKIKEGDPLPRVIKQILSQNTP